MEATTERLKVWGDMTVIAKQIPGYGRERRWAAVSCEVDDAGELHISGVIGSPRQLRRGDADTGGQCIDAIAEIPRECLTDEWDAARLAALVGIWRRWHLNHMNAGCEHQREMNWNADDNLSQPCPVCGYRYGTAWLKEDLPPEVVAFAEAFNS